MSKALEHQLVERFMRYSAISSQSNAANIGKCLPTSPGQQVLAELIASELRELGLDNVQCDQHATVTAVKRGSVSGCPRIGFITHLDTVDVGLSPIVKAQKLFYEGGDVQLSPGHTLRVDEHPEISRYVGQEILFSDGTSVLGADDKAAVTNVMQMLVNLTPEDKHGDFVVCFVPDEEIGLLGAKNLDVKSRFDVDFAYTIDCCELGEVVYENFNAASVELQFTGVTAHPMSAKGVLVNPLLMAMDFIAMFDRNETPECTEGREGYQWFAGAHGNQSAIKIDAMIREFDVNKFNERKEAMYAAAEKIRSKYPTGKVEVTIHDTYSNISNCIGEDRTAIDLLFEALEKAGVPPKVTAMRGGTDGAALSQQGLLTPNYFTGAHNFHSKFEFLPIPAFVKSYEVTRNLVLLAATKAAKKS